MRKYSFILLVLFCFALPIHAKLVKLTPADIQYGEIKEGKVITDKIKILNAGDQEVEIVKVRPGCGCTFANLNQHKLEPGDTAVIEFNFNSRGFSGPVRKGITVYFKDATKPPFKYAIKANVLREFEVSPRYIYLNKLNLNPDTTIVQKITFKNNSKEDILVKNLFTTSDMIHLPENPFKVKAGESKKVDIEVIPNREIQSRQKIEVQTDSESKPTFNISVYLYVKDRK